MHEMSIAHSILTQVESLQIQHQAERVIWIKIRIGKISGVVAEQLQYAFDIYKLQFPTCKETELKIDELEIKTRCRDCGRESEQQELFLACSFCGSIQVDIIQGQEMIIEQVELDVPDA